ncbi:hypothetical protein [Staphylococcus borealis]|uniref:hypothetical protein n=1 Tax=Staphylococcus borealis TaxID=2742203 RepID=UPI00211CED43|nr:hypothetical protein [Staphylococcus borealis]
MTELLRRLNQAFLSSSHPCGGGRGPNTKNHESDFTSKASWESGPQQREFHQEILQAKQAGSRGPSKENFIKKFYKQSKLGVDDELKIFCPSPYLFYLINPNQFDIVKLIR